ncbi:hypothetical protein EYF80_043895 [Liparis tanakae]|uniref:Uncharacterized protein n=1 Tax=Liparis tanakae TaxID=230148 RepID=A0A4Z2FYB8_9TELE|nr:hypothetical protein EYF80_043895 [Liparis tanakae]
MAGSRDLATLGVGVSVTLRGVRPPLAASDASDVPVRRAVDRTPFHCSALYGFSSQEVELMIWLPNELKDLLLMEHFPLRSGSADSLRDLARHGGAAERNGSLEDSQRPERARCRGSIVPVPGRPL